MAAAPDAPTGTAGPGLESFDAIVLDILKTFEIPGASLALVRDGRLVLARGYGLADVDAGQPVEPTTRFLLASVSKSITAVTVLKLVEEGRAPARRQGHSRSSTTSRRRPAASRIRGRPTSPCATSSITLADGTGAPAAIP